MNKYQKILNRATQQKLDNDRLKVKKKYAKKWLEGGTPVTHPIHIAYEKEFNNIDSYLGIRKTLKSKHKNINDLKKLNRRLSKSNKKLYDEVFKENI